MNRPKRNNVLSKRLRSGMICLNFILVIAIAKIAPCTSTNFTGNIKGDGVSEIFVTFPLNELWSSTGTTNYIYQKTFKDCSKVNQFIMNLDSEEPNMVKSPPVVATVTGEPKNNHGYSLLKGTRILVNLTKPLKLLLCNDRLDFLEWVQYSLLMNDTSPLLNIDFSVKFNNQKINQIIRKIPFEFASVIMVKFYDPPECFLVDDVNHKVFWSDSEQGIIEVYDPKENSVKNLVNLLANPKSMVIDSNLGLLFWCNVEFIGSIERINFDGSNRVKITEGRYDLFYPDALGINHKKKMLYWMVGKAIHTSDYTGDFHTIIEKSHSYEPNIPRCFTFDNTVEYNFFWEKPQVPYHDRYFTPNHLLSISYQKDEKQTHNNARRWSKLRVQKLQQNTWNASHMCQKIPSGYYCFILPIPLTGMSYVKVNRMLSMAGYKPMKLNELSKFHPKHEKLLLKIESFYYNSKLRNTFYYDKKTKNIRFISCLEEHPIDIIKNIDIPINGFSYDGVNNIIYFINTTENSIMMSKLDKNNIPKDIITTVKNTFNTTVLAMTIDTQHTRLLFFVSHYLLYNITNNTTNNEADNESVITYFIRNVNMFSPDLIVINSKLNKLYLINTTDSSVEQFNFNGTDHRRHQSPFIISYITKFMEYKNNAQTISLQKQFISSMINMFALALL